MEARNKAGKTADLQKSIGRRDSDRRSGRTGNTKSRRQEARRSSRKDGKPTAGVDREFRTPEHIIFEGRRASAKDGKPKDLKFKGSKGAGGKGSHKKKSAKDGRGAVRAAKWRAQKEGDKG